MTATEHFSPLELELLNHARTGEWWPHAYREGASNPVSIPATFLQQLATGRLARPPLRMIRISGAMIEGVLDFESDALAVSIFLHHCQLDEVNLEQAQAPGVFIRGSRMGMLSATQLSTQNLFLDGSTVTGGVNLDNAEISGVLNLEDAHLVGSEECPGFKGHNLVVAKDLAAARLRIDGAVDLVGARVGGVLDFGGAFVHNPNRIAVNVSTTQVDNGAILAAVDAQGKVRNFVANGEVLLVGALIRGPLDMRGAQINGTSERALTADLLRVEGDLRATHLTMEEHPLKVTGPLRLPGAHVAGRLNLSGAQITNPGKPKCFFAEGLTVGEDLDLTGATVQGPCSLSGATIGDKLKLVRAEFTEDLNLKQATTRELIDIDTVWPKKLSLSHFDYGTFPGVDEPSSVDARIAWLGENASGYAPNVYNHLAAVYRAAGEEDAARRVLIAKQRRKFQCRRAAHPSRVGWLQVAGDRLLDWTVGYGYRPLRMAWWLIGLLAAASLLFQYVLNENVRPKPESEFYSPIYALDLLLPVAGLGQRSNIVVFGPGLWWSTVFMLTGWLLGLTLIAGLSGLFKKD
jgi:uncharacterized protein YjbI with pentapeptide repeats